MPLVNAKEMLTKAKAGHYAVGQFNINNLEWTKSILLTAQEMNSPVILGVSEGAGKYMCGYKTVVGMVNGMLEELKITVPVAISPQFYAWVFGLKNYVTIEGPPSVAEGMKDMLSAVGKRYEGAQ